MKKPLIQVAIDLLDFNAVVELANQVSPFVDILEIGTPCIKYNGIKMLHALKEKFPENKVLVDLKTMDAGEYEATPFFEAGADICTVLGAADLSTITGHIKAAQKFGKECQVDLINVSDKASLAKELIERGAHILGIHTGLDQQAAGHTPFSDLLLVKGLDLKVKISVAGGIKLNTFQEAMESGADIIVVGAAIYGASNPAEAAQSFNEKLLNFEEGERYVSKTDHR